MQTYIRLPRQSGPTLRLTSLSSQPTSLANPCLSPKYAPPLSSSPPTNTNTTSPPLQSPSPLPTLQTLWASVSGRSHDHRYSNPGEHLSNFTEYWNIIQSQSSCEYFKQYKVGWFMHTYDDQQEPRLGMINDQNQTKMNFDPQPC